MSFTINTILFVFLLIICLIGGAIGGFFLARYVVKKELKEHPLISEAQIKAMYRSMGRTPSQAQINQTMRAINEAGNTSNKNSNKKKK